MPTNEDISFVGKFDDPQDPRQVEELWAWMMRMQARLNQFDPGAVSTSWIEGAASGQLIISQGTGVAPVWSGTVPIASMSLSGLTASELVATDASKNLVSMTPDGGWSAANYSSDKALDASAATLPEVANVLCSLIDALKSKKVLS